MRFWSLSFFSPLSSLELTEIRYTHAQRIRRQRRRNVPETPETEIRQAVPLLPTNRCVPEEDPQVSGERV